MNLTNTWRARVYDALLRGDTFTAPETVYLRIFADDPAVGPEAAGGSYTGQPLTMGVSAPGAGSNSAPVTFTNMPAGTWTHWAIATTAAGSDFAELILVGELTSPRTTSEGASLPLAAGDLDVTVL